MRKGILPDQDLPLLRGSNEEIRGKSECCFRFAFQEIFQTLRALSLGVKHKVAALQDRANLEKAEILGEVSERGHGDLLVSAEVDRPKQGNKRPHLPA
jgi:hypothetical protein